MTTMNYNLNQDFRQLSVSEEDDREFDEAVSKYPSSYDLKLTPLTKPMLKSIRDNLLGKVKCGFVLLEEELQAYNLISYLSFRLGKVEIAFDYNRKVLEKDRSNGIAFANRARFNKKMLYFSDAEEDLKQLERLYETDNADSTIKVMAKGDLAHSYARFGPKFHEMAIAKYESLLETAPNIKKDVLILWKYDYCVCLRRTLHLYNIPEHPERDSVETIRKACVTLSDIIDTSPLKVYKARAFTELGQLVYGVEKKPESLDRSILECIPGQYKCNLSKSYFDRALEIENNDFQVLVACAKFFRYYNKLKLAVDLFQKALQQRTTSAVYHHLALCIRKSELGRISSHKNAKKKRQKKLAVASDHSTPTLQQREQKNLERLIKCEREPTLMRLNERTMQVLEYLEKALELSPFNYTALYDRAVLFRHLQQNEDAKRVFCKLNQSLEISELKVSCYEQAGYCCLDMAKTYTIDSSKHNNDAIRYFQRAIEVAAVLAAKVKYTSLDVRHLLPTVKSMLTAPELLEIHDKQMQRLQNLLIQYGKLLPITMEVTSDSVKDINALLERCLQEDRRDDAALICILKEIASVEDDDTFEEHLIVILRTASTALSNGDYESAVTRYQICSRLLGFRIHEENREYDVFLMTDGESENLEPLYLVSEWLGQYCGLKTINSDEHLCSAEPALNALTELSLRSTAVFVVLKYPTIDHLVRYVTDAIIANQPKTRPKLVILKDKSVKMPETWRNIPAIQLPQVRDQYTDANISEWLSSVFKAVIKSQSTR